MKGKKSRLFKNILWGIFWMLVGVALCVSSFLVPTIQVEPYLKWVVLGFGALMIIVSAVCVAVFAGRMKRFSKDGAGKSEAAAELNVAKQTGQQKLAQIDLMDDIQFVMYASRLFQANGYVVRFTPTSNNYGVSFLAQKDSVATAVICKQSVNAVSKEQIKDACSNWAKYPCKYATFVTNATVEKSARRFLRKNDIGNH